MVRFPTPGLWSPWAGDMPVPMEGDIRQMNAQTVAEGATAAGSAPHGQHTPLGAIDCIATTKAADRVTGGPGRRPTDFNSAL
jgi:hypothetical protein